MIWETEKYMLADICMMKTSGGRFLTWLKGRFFVKETLEETINVLFALAIDGMADHVICRRKSTEKSLEHLLLVKGTPHFRIGRLNVSGEALDLYPSILDISIL